MRTVVLGGHIIQNKHSESCCWVFTRQLFTASDMCVHHQIIREQILRKYPQSLKICTSHTGGERQREKAQCQAYMAQE